MIARLKAALAGLALLALALLSAFAAGTRKGRNSAELSHRAAEAEKYKAVAEKVTSTAATARQAEIEIGEKSSDEVRKELADRWSVDGDDGRLQDHEGSRSN